MIIIAAAAVLILTHAQSVSQDKSLGTAALGALIGVPPSASSSLGNELNALQQENASLRVQLFNQSISQPDTVKVYSSYPLNTKQEITIAAGSNQGVNEGDVVTWGDNVLVGKVITVMSDSSIISTIFDQSWQMAVRIGTAQIDGLLNGGNSPAVTLIPKDGQINPGDMVVTATKGFPYGLEVGVVKDVSNMPNSVFREATLQTEFNINDLRDVTVRH